MMPNAVKGKDLGGLLRYLAGPGRANEHTNPTVLAGDLVTMAVYAGAIDVPRATELARYLDSPRQTVLRGAPVLSTSYGKARALMAEGMSRKEAFEEATKDENTWHCSLSLAPREGRLTPEKWGQIARRFMREMGYIEREDGAPDVRWTAIHHGLTKQGGDHIHIAMSVVRPDGSLADMYRDRPRAQEAAGVLEHEFGLEVLASREDRSTEQATRPHERARATRIGAPETDREALRRRVRAAAAATENEAEFVRAVREDGVMVRPRYAKGGTEEVTGFAVRMPVQKNLETGAWEKPVWYSAGKLSKDLTLAAIRGWTGWVESDESRAAALAEWGRAMTTRSGRALRQTPLDQRAALDQLTQWSAAMREIPVGDRAAWARAASQTAGLFAAASVRTETTPGPLDALARQLARAAQLPAHQRRPHGVPGTGPRSVAQMLRTAHTQSRRDETVELVIALTECLLAVADMLAATKRAETAAAMTAQAQRALTEIHMRAAGIDPNRPHTRAPGSPPWVAAAQAEAVVTRVDRAVAESHIEDMSRTWATQQVALAGRTDAGRVDEFGHIVKRGPGYKAYRLRPAGPPVPPANAERETQRARDRRAAEAAVEAAREAEEREKMLARLREGSREPGRFDPRRPLSGLQDLGYGEGAEESETPDHESSTPKPQTNITPPPTRGRGRGRDHGFER
ncbi:relaxase/mobilization nuclease domain-containing protein [Nocardia grenadensis]